MAKPNRAAEQTNALNILRQWNAKKKIACKYSAAFVELEPCCSQLVFFCHLLVQKWWVCFNRTMERDPWPRDRRYAHNMVWCFLSAMSLSQTDPSSEQGAGRKKPERNLWFVIFFGVILRRPVQSPMCAGTCCLRFVVNPCFLHSALRVFDECHAACKIARAAPREMVANPNPNTALFLWWPWFHLHLGSLTFAV